MQLSGKIIAALEARTGTSQKGNTWMSQEFVIETFDQYPKKMCFQMFGEDRLKNANIKIGEPYIVDFSINAREYNGRWYNTIDASKVTPLNGNVAAGSDPFGAQPVQATNQDEQPF